ncbi:MAG: TRAP transporter permease, partial [Pseudomonadota bacterium]
MTTQDPNEIPADRLAELERSYDPESAFRATGSTMTAILLVPLVGLALYQYYASGFGLIRELLHRGIFLAFMLGLLFLLFSWRKSLT